MYELSYAQGYSDTKGYQRRKRQSPKRHVSGRIRQVPRVTCDEIQKPPHPSGRRHGEINGSEDEPVTPIFEDGAEPAQEAQRIFIQVQKV